MARTNVGAAAKSSVRRIRTTEKTLRALELRKRGLNYTDRKSTRLNSSHT